MRLRRFLVASVLCQGLVPGYALACGFAIDCLQDPVMVMDKLEITVHNNEGFAISPECIEPWDSDWTCEVINEGSGVSTVVFSGDTDLSTSWTHIFRIMDDVTPGSFLIHRAAWVLDESRFELPLPVVEFKLSETGDEVTVTLRNDYSDDLKLWSVHYRTVTEPFPIEELIYPHQQTAYYTWVPDFQNYILSAGEEVSFSFGLAPPLAVALTRVQAAWADNPGTFQLAYTQMSASEMVTPTAASTWSKIKSQY